MTSSTLSSDPSSGPASNLPAYFNNLSKTYALQTGNATLNLFATLVSHLAPITPDSIIHDNASGPGTATSVILANLPHGAEYPTIIATDMVPAMIDAFQSSISSSQTHDKTSSQVMKAEALSFPDAYFTHSTSNSSIFNFASPFDLRRGNLPNTANRRPARS